VEKFKGCILGCALGDAVGAWAEARPSAEAHYYATHFVREFDFSKVGKHHHGMTFGQYTDDTQLTRELALSLVDEGEWAPDSFADRIARAFAQDLVVGYGRATQEAAIRLLDGAAWDEAGTPPPRAGNGAAMRAGPVGLLWWDDVDRLLVVATEQAIITHKAEMSVAGSVAIAAAVAMSLNASRTTSGPHELGWWGWLARFVERYNADFGQAVSDLATMVFKGRKTEKWEPGEGAEYGAVLAWTLEGDDSHWDGISPWARTSVLWSLYCLMAHPRDVWKAIELSIMPGGDVDTTAAMAGALVGAHVGIDAFPAQVLEKVAPWVHDDRSPEWDWARLEKLAEQLHAVAARRHEARYGAQEEAVLAPILNLFGTDQ
jgi:ADP-ribosylglycohydrolase